MYNSPGYSRLSFLKKLIIKLSPINKFKYHRVFVAYAILLEKRIVGLCHIEVYILKNISYGIYGIVIIPPFQGKGLGKLLSVLTIAKVFNKFNNIKFIKLYVDYDNLNAIKLYRKLGFRKIAFHKNFDIRYNTPVHCYEMILTKDNFLKAIQNFYDLYI